MIWKMANDRERRNLKLRRCGRGPEGPETWIRGFTKGKKGPTSIIMITAQARIVVVYEKRESPNLMRKGKVTPATPVPVCNSY